MKKIFLLIPAVAVLLVNCSGIKEQKVVDVHHKNMEIAFSFNTDHYPWLLGTKYPQLAVWVESETGGRETVFVTQGAGKNKWMFADERPGALPVWSGVRSERQDLDVDAVTGATPSGEVHTIVWQVPEKMTGTIISVYIEANVSFDYNESYTKDKDSLNYSGVNGQPSVVWKTSFRVDENPREMTPEIIGHGHVAGNDRAVDTDISGLTTAVELFNYLKIAYHPGSQI